MSAQQMARQITLAVLGDGEPDPAPEICLRLFAQGYLGASLGLAEREVLVRKILRALQSAGAFGEKGQRVAEALAGDLVDPAPTERVLPRDRRRAESQKEREDENVYQGVATVDGTLHPLALVPPEVLEAARSALHEVLIEDGEIPIDMASPVADTPGGGAPPDDAP